MDGKTSRPSTTALPLPPILLRAYTDFAAYRMDTFLLRFCLILSRPLMQQFEPGMLFDWCAERWMAIGVSFL
jgi:hypothetical protein